MVRGGTIPAILSAVVYIACREMGISKTVKDIAAASNIRRKELAKTYWLLVFELELEIPIVDLIKYIFRVADKAALSENTKRHAIGIMNDVIKKAYLLERILKDSQHQFSIYRV